MGAPESAKKALTIWSAWPVPRCSACRTNWTPVGVDGGSYAVGLVADDAVDVVGWNDLFGGGDDMEEERATADLVEDFGALTLEPRAFSGGHDGDGEVMCFHASLSSHGPPFRSLLTAADSEIAVARGSG